MITSMASDAHSALDEPLAYNDPGPHRRRSDLGREPHQAPRDRRDGVAPSHHHRVSITPCRPPPSESVSPRGDEVVTRPDHQSGLGRARTNVEGPTVAGVDRSNLPIRRPSFDGVVNRTLDGSQPDWNLIGHPTPPEGAPNVLVVLIDDAGFGNPSTFGGPDRDAELHPDRRARGCATTASTSRRCALRRVPRS